MENGWICIHRKIRDHWIWGDKPFDKKSAWIDLLLSANHNQTKFMLGNEIISAERGDIITSELKLAERWGWSRTKVRDFLKLLEREGMISQKKDSKKTVLNIVNYGIYQDLQTEKEQQKNNEKTAEEHQKNIEETSKEHQKNTNNNDNNKNNENKDNKKTSRARVFTVPSVADVQAYCEERGNRVDAERFVDYYTANGWKVGKNSMKDWKAAVRNWEKQDAERAEGQNGVRRQGVSNQYGGNDFLRMMAEFEEEEG